MKRSLRWVSVLMTLALALTLGSGSVPAATTLGTTSPIKTPVINIKPNIPIIVTQPDQSVTTTNPDATITVRPNIPNQSNTGSTTSQVTMPTWVVDGLKQPTVSKAFEKAFLERNKLLAVNAPETHVMSGNTLPYNYDLSKYVSFTENQDGWGGCILRSIMHTIQIENEKRCVFTPDPSFWYVHQRQEYLANGGPIDTTYTLSYYGVCPEGSFPSNYDKATKVGDGWSLSSMPTPTVANDVEASYYKALLSSPYSVDVNTMKQYMMKYGPLLLGGPMIKIQGPNPAEGHCVTAVGWDDSMQAFKILNSWGDQWNGNGYIWLRYNELAANCDDWQYIEDQSKDRTGTKFAYSARINIWGTGAAMRNQLAVKIGVVGKDSWVFWDHPNQVACSDESKNLCIDIPLPDFASASWPPSDDNIWYIEVTNDNGDPVKLESFSLARQTSQNTVESYSWQFSFSNSVPGYTKQTYAIPHLAQITLQKPKNMHNGWIAGSSQNITWSTAPAGMGSVQLYYSQNGGTNWIPLVKKNNTGSYPWQVPNLDINNARILAEYLVDNVVVAQDDSGDFAIGPTSSLFKAPTNLTAKAYGKQIYLSWDDNNQLDGVQYVIERKSGNENFSVLTTVPQGSSYVDKDTYPKDAGSMIIKEKTYTYRVRAVNGQQYSNYSNEASATADFMAKPLQKIPTKIPLTTTIIDIPHELPIPHPEPDWKTTPSIETPGINTTPISSISTESPVSNGTVLKFIIGDSGYWSNNKSQTMDTVPIVIEGRTMLPIHYVAENLGASISWNQAEQKCTITSDGKEIELWIGQSTAKVNGVEVQIDPGNSGVTPFLTAEGRTLLPMRFIAEQLGCQVQWNASTQEIQINAAA
ncbi:MAG TPA: stalk domain-containing protein [Syntrophomonadaceae bacterium]|nr:stalk domain-containing protein [Syntrophomonadaceae bacterium]